MRVNGKKECPTPEIELIATATFGLEAVVRREIERLGYPVLRTEDAKVTFRSDIPGIVRANLHLRCADRILLKMGEFPALTSEDLFQGTKALPWDAWIDPDGKFTVTCTTVKSRLRSEPACQKTVKKAIVERLRSRYGIDRFPETGARYTVKVTILRDRATLTIDTSGDGLHKRGYRVESVMAPMKETLAAALVQLSFWNRDRILLDPFCGSGTIPIEAAMYACGIAPGLHRAFASREWPAIPEAVWKEEIQRAYRMIDSEARLQIFASDADPHAVEAARKNAEEAGVDGMIRFQTLPFQKLKVREPYSIMISNPPYGERIGEKEELQSLYRKMDQLLRDETFSAYVITADRRMESLIRCRKPDRRRKLYNGRIEACYYQYYGTRPPKDPAVTPENEGAEPESF